MKKLYCFICGKYRKFEKTKTSCLQKKYQLFLLFAVSVKMKTKKYLKKKNKLKYQKFLVLLIIKKSIMPEENMNQEISLKKNRRNKKLFN